MASDERASGRSDQAPPESTDGSATDLPKLQESAKLDPAEALDAAADSTPALDGTSDTGGDADPPLDPVERAEAQAARRLAADGSTVADESLGRASRVEDAPDSATPFSADDGSTSVRPARGDAEGSVADLEAPTGNAGDGSAGLPPKVSRWLAPESRSRRLLLATLIYVVCIVVFGAVAGKPRMTEHTAFNHYAHLADAWLHGRQDLRNGPPAYAQGNDFAQFQGKTYISFPPFPAVLMMPFVALAGSPEDFRDGQFMVWLAGVGPAVLFLVLEKLRRRKISLRTERENLALSCLLAFGTVYFFTAVEGTVWFAAHVVGVGLAALYLLFALDAERPFLAGLCLACSWMTRPSTVLIGLVFFMEALRVSCKHGLPEEGTLEARMRLVWERVELGRFARKLAPFAAPIATVLVLSSAMNYARFGNPSPTAFGHEHLSVVWKGRIQDWGLFGYHYLPKNLGVMLTILPWRPPQHAACFEGGNVGAIDAGVAFVKGLFGARPACTPFRINEHGLALWFTTPLYFWLFRPKARSYTYTLLGVAALLPCLLDLLYQNSGWRQFGYRFSNDYAILLFVLLALGHRPMGGLFKACAAWSVAWNLFGAATFDRGEHDRFYFREGTQSVLYQGD